MLRTEALGLLPRAHRLGERTTLQKRRKERSIWRASLTSPQTGERAGIANLQELFHLLQRQTGAVPDTRGEQDVGQQKGGDHDKNICSRASKTRISQKTMRKGGKMIKRTFALTVVALMLALPGAIHAQEADPLSMITAWHDAMNAYNADAALAFLADDAYIQLVPPPMEGHDGVFRGKEEIRAWWENLYSLNSASTVSNCQVDGETVACLLNYTDDGLTALGLDSIDNDFVVIVQDGKIQTYTATMTDESLAALMAAMPPQAMPETGGNAFPISAVVVALGGLAVTGGLGMRVFVLR